MGFGSGGGKFGSGRSDLDSDLTIDGSVKIKEGSAADADIAGQGQLWVKSDAPNNLYFTDDTGQDVQITSNGALAGVAGSLSGLGSTDNVILRSNGTGGETAQGSGVLIDDSNNFTIPTTAKIQFRDTGLFINSSANGQLDVDADTELELTAPTVDIDASTTLTVDTAVFSIDGTDDSNLTVTASGKDLDLAVAGGGTQELRLASAGTGAAAIHLNASAGGIDIDSADMIDIDAADEITIDTTSADGHIAVTSAHTAGQAILISANADAGSILDIDAGIIDIDVQDTISIDAADEIEIATTSADGHITLTSAHTAGVAFHIDANANAGSIVDIDAGILDIDVTGDATIDAASLTVTTDTATFASANSTDPLLVIKNTTNDANGARFHFVKDKGAAGADGDDIGVIDFIADDAAQTQTTFARILAEVSESADSDEAGKLSFFVAESDGTDTALAAGLVLEGEHATNGEVDVTIGAGAASLTTIVGTSQFNAAATFGADDTGVDVRMFSATASEGVLYDASEDELGLLLTTKLSFHDIGGGENIFASANGHLEINAGTTLDMTAPTVDINASTTATVDTAIFSIDGTDDSNITVTGSAKDLDLAVAGGGTQELRIASAGTGTAAIHLNASAGGIDIDSADMIDIDAADEITITTTSADGHISLVSAHTAGVALHIDADANAGSILDIDAGIVDMDVTGAITMTAGGLLKTEAAGVEIENASDSGAVALLIDNNDVDKIALDIDGANTTANVLDINAPDLTSGIALSIDATGGDCVEAMKISHAITTTTANTSFPGYAALHIDSSRASNTTNAAHMTGIAIDMDENNANGGTNIMRGLWITPTLIHDTDAGSPVVKGAEIAVTGGANGSGTRAMGLDLVVTGADFNQGIHIKSNVGGSGTSPSGNHLKLISGAEDNDTFQISVMANGETLLKSIDSGSSGSDADAHIHVQADGNLTLDAEADIIFDAKGNDFNFKSDGTEILRITNSSSDVITKPTVNQKNLIFQQQDGLECARVVDGMFGAGEAPVTNAIGLSPGFGYRTPVMVLNAASGDVAATLTAAESGYTILLVPAAHAITVTLPALTAETGLGLHYKFVCVSAVAGDKVIQIKTAGAGADNNDNFFLHNSVIGGATSFDGDGDTLQINNATAAGAIVECLAISSDTNVDTSSTDETWLAEAKASVAVTCID